MKKRDRKRKRERERERERVKGGGGKKRGREIESEGRKQDRKALLYDHEKIKKNKVTHPHHLTAN